MNKSDVNKETYDRIANKFDQELEFSERMSGIKVLRDLLIRERVKGKDVLEVMCGTGRNIEAGLRYARSVVLADVSENMVNEAKRKMEERTMENGSKVMVEIGDSRKMMYKSESFDCVVDTFGLCSTSEPELVLREMFRVCRKGGYVLLLEHGRPAKGTVHDYWLSNILDAHAQKHEMKWGCAWNKDIEKIVKDAMGKAESNNLEMELERFDRWHFGTTSYVVLRRK